MCLENVVSFCGRKVVPVKSEVSVIYNLCQVSKGVLHSNGGRERCELVSRAKEFFCRQENELDAGKNEDGNEK